MTYTPVARPPHTDTPTCECFKCHVGSIHIGSRKRMSREGVNWFDTTIAEQQRAAVAEAKANGHDIVPVPRRAELR